MTLLVVADQATTEASFVVPDPHTESADGANWFLPPFSLPQVSGQVFLELEGAGEPFATDGAFEKVAGVMLHVKV